MEKGRKINNQVRKLRQIREQMGAELQNEALSLFNLERLAAATSFRLSFIISSQNIHNEVDSSRQRSRSKTREKPLVGLDQTAAIRRQRGRLTNANFSKANTIAADGGLTGAAVTKHHANWCFGTTPSNCSFELTKFGAHSGAD